jgi:hypothetical protein
VDGSLSWIKTDQNGNLLAGATFEVCQTHGFDSSNDPWTFPELDPPPDCLTVLDNSGQEGYDGLDADAVGGQFLLEDLYLGTYTIEETIAPPGYKKSDEIQEVTLDLDNPDGEAPEPFINVRLYKLIVITCNESLNELVVSQVTVDGEVKYTFGPGDHPWVLNGLQDPDICGITDGATYGGLAGGLYTPEVELPDDPDTPTPPNP